MTPMRGWSLRPPLLAKVPHSRWKTLTFLAGLRHDRIVAPNAATRPAIVATYKPLSAGPDRRATRVVDAH
jgi:hypothetical protein